MNKLVNVFGLLTGLAVLVTFVLTMWTDVGVHRVEFQGGYSETNCMGLAFLLSIAVLVFMFAFVINGLKALICSSIILVSLFISLRFDSHTIIGDWSGLTFIIFSLFGAVILIGISGYRLCKRSGQKKEVKDERDTLRVS